MLDTKISLEMLISGQSESAKNLRTSTQKRLMKKKKTENDWLLKLQSFQTGLTFFVDL